jgi:hypothetical protein
LSADGGPVIKDVISNQAVQADSLGGVILACWGGVT